MPWFFHHVVPFRPFPSVSDAISCNKVLNFPFLKFFPAKFSPFSKSSANMPWFFRRMFTFRSFRILLYTIFVNNILNYVWRKKIPAKFYVPFLSCLCLVLVASETSLQHFHHGIISREHPEEDLTRSQVLTVI